MRLAVCDDEPEELRQVGALLERYRARRPGLALSAVFFFGPEDLLRELKTQPPFDGYLLDILMDGMTGIDLAEELSALQHAPVVIFLTNSADYAVDAFRVRARHYLLKPIAEADFFAALDELFPSSKGLSAVTISTAENNRVTLPVSDIAYAECVIHTVRYHMSDGTVYSSRSIRVPFAEFIQDLMDSSLFLLTHRSFAVNLGHILRLTDRSVVLRGGEELPLSRLRLNECRSAYLDYLLKRGGAT